MSIRVSIVINTYNRAASLADALASFRRLNYDNFEVVVVNGPSTESTGEVLQAFRREIRVGTCSDRSLGISRNVGIEMARGEIVAFIDDDAIPQENWLNDIVVEYDSDEIGGVGGFVYDHTGYNLQYKHCLCDRLGIAQAQLTEPASHHSYPGSPKFPHLLGTNATYRRSSLLEIGGFDEEFDYYLDETDVCLRMIDAGFVIRQVAGAFVYHRFKPSYIRDNLQICTYWYPVVKNKVYFLLRHSGLSMRALLREIESFALGIEDAINLHIARGVIGEGVLEQFRVDAEQAIQDGLARGLSRPQRLLGTDIAKQLRGPVAIDVFDHGNTGAFLKFPTILLPDQKLNICLLSQEYPPGVVGGIAKLTFELARSLSVYGHVVHVLTRSSGAHNTVDYESGVWVHRMVEDGTEPGPPPGISVPPGLWRHSYRMLLEIRRIQESQPVDIVEAPLWDAEGLAVVLDGSFRTVTSLETPLKLVLASNPGMDDGSETMRTFLDQLIAAETMVVERATAVRAISAAIRETIRSLYQIRFGPEQVVIAPIGIEDRSTRHYEEKTEPFLDILFTGRFEGRKGIDLLFDVIPSICLAHDSVRFILVGEDSWPGSDGRTKAEEFRAVHSGEPFLKRVLFPGKVPDEERDRLLAQCDIFVAPSRYESFGIVFLEAMMFGKPVIGARAGGMPEVVMDGITGLLVEPGDAGSLRQAIETLIEQPDLRVAFGKAGRDRFLKHFTSQRMAERSIALYQRLIERTDPSAMRAVR